MIQYQHLEPRFAFGYQVSGEIFKMINLVWFGHKT